MKPSKHKMTVLSQIFKLIPRNLIPKLANDFGIDRQSRVFSPTSHVLALVFGQLTHALGLNDICDTLRNHCGLVSKIRDCVPAEPEWSFPCKSEPRCRYGGKTVLGSSYSFE